MCPKQLRPPVKASLSCWSLIQAQRTQTSPMGVYLIPSSSACVNCGWVPTNARELLCSKAVLSAGDVIVAHSLYQILKQIVNSHPFLWQCLGSTARLHRTKNLYGHITEKTGWSQPNLNLSTSTQALTTVMWTDSYHLLQSCKDSGFDFRGNYLGVS